jgi:acyl-CoA thioester hydrolase
MPRVKLQEQLEYEFRHDLTVRVTDINYGGHLGNDSLVGLIHEARVHLMHDLGCNEDDLGDHKIGLIMADLVVNFVREGFLFDKLRIDSHIGEITHSSFRIFHRVVKVGELIALAETGMIAFNYSDRKIALLPRKFLQTLDDFLEKN